MIVLWIVAIGVMAVGLAWNVTVAQAAFRARAWEHNDAVFWSALWRLVVSALMVTLAAWYLSWSIP